MFGLGLQELIIIGLLGATLIGGLMLMALLLGRRRAAGDLEAGLREDLAEFLPPPQAGTHRLTFEGLPARVRLVVLAPAGRLTALSAEMAEGILQTVVHGLGEVADLDRPRVRIWPPQLSQEGFTSKFFANVRRPERAGEMSPWILVAGPARAGQKTVLLGLALQTIEPTARGSVRMDPEKWPDKFRVQVVG